MRSWLQAFPPSNIFLWQSDQAEQSLVLLQSGPQGSSGSRALVYPAPETNLSAEDCLALCEDLFFNLPVLYDLTVELSASPPSDKVLQQLEAANIKCWQHPSGSGPWPYATWGFYLRRLALYSPVIHLPFHNFGIMFEEDSSHDHIIAVHFIQPRQTFTPGPPAFLLNDLGLLGGDLRYQPNGQITAAKPAAPISYSPLLLEAERQAKSYLAGSTVGFDLPYKILQGTKFQNQVWAQISQIPYGTAWSYSDLAARIVGPAKAHTYARAVGGACGANPLPLLIPCHRVIGQDGQLVGFSGGVEIKDRLLNLELFNYKQLDQ